MAIESQQQAFEKFERDSVRVPDSENREAKKVHPEIRGALEEQFERVVKTFLSGSYSRKVQVVKLNDVDVIVVLADPDGTFEASAGAALEWMREAAKGSDLVRHTKLGVRAVKLSLHGREFTVDLVAAREPEDGGEGLLLARHRPEKGHDDWQLLNPEGQKRAATDKNEETDRAYIPGVRIVKFWNQGEGKPLKNYHAEAILWHALHGPTGYPELAVRFFDEAYARLAPGVRTPDPGAPGADPVDHLLEADDRAAARKKVEKARRMAHQAFESADLGESLDLWAEVFGPAFPAPSTSSEKIAGALGSGIAGVSGTGVRPGRGREVVRARSWSRR
jgi:predicted nucleotidyltransferase